MNQMYLFLYENKKMCFADRRRQSIQSVLRGRSDFDAAAAVRRGHRVQGRHVSHSEPASKGRRHVHALVRRALPRHQEEMGSQGKFFKSQFL